MSINSGQNRLLFPILILLFFASSGTARASAPQCTYGAYNTSTNRCEVSASIASYYCPSGTGYAISGSTCQAAPPCNAGYSYNTVTNRCETNATGPTYSCSTGTLSGTICYQTAGCSAGTLNGTTDKCEYAATAVYSCPSGSGYTLSGTTCQGTPPCNAGYTYNTTNNRCETNAVVNSVSASGAAGGGACLLTASGNTLRITDCSLGLKGNITLTGCTAVASGTISLLGGSVSTSGNAINFSLSGQHLTLTGCTAAGSGVIGGNVTLTASGNSISFTGPGASGSITLSPSPLYSCPTGTLSGTICYQTVTCQTTTPASSLNTTSDKCEYAAQATSYTCPSGGTLSGTTCQVTPTCNAGYTYNTSNNRCEVNATGPTYSCSTGTLSGTICYQGVTCQTTTPISGLNPTTDKCEYAGSVGSYSCASYPGYTLTGSLCYKTATCLTGTTLNTTDDQCEAAPTCMVGTTYDSTNHLCAVALTCLTGTTYNATTGKCEVAPTCATGTSYNTSTNRCEVSATYYCPTGTTWNSVDNWCEVSATCSNSGTLNGVADKCQLFPTPDCTIYLGTFYNSTSNRCEAAPVWTCVSGYIYNIVTAVCEAAGPCGANLSYNGTTGQCEGTKVYTCAVGTYNAVNGVCEYAPSCLSGTTYSTGLNLCTISSSGPSGTTLNTATGKYEAPPACLTGTTYSLSAALCTAPTTCQGTDTLNISSGVCQSSATYACPAGSAWNTSAGKCVAVPTCSSSGAFNGVTGKCDLAAIPDCSKYPANWNATAGVCQSAPVCQSGTAYSSGPHMCVAPATCAGSGALNTANDVCQALPVCDAGAAYSTLNHRCEENPTSNFSCQTGTYDSGSGKCYVGLTCPAPGAIAPNSNTPLCKASPILNCPAGTIPGPKIGSNITCQSPPICAVGAYSGQVKACMLMGVDLCPAGYAYDKTTDECQENPLCSNSTFDPTQGKCCSCASTNTCLTTNSGSSYQCSADKCVDLAANPPTGTQTDLTYYHNNGTVTQNGCSAQIYIFNGKPEQCREAGTQTTWNNCCNPATGLFGANGGCDPLTDLATNADRNAGLCHLVDDSGGAYCMESWPVVGCVQRAEVYCCFKSKLARIIQEQGRKQFKTFGGVNGWGYVTWPDCRGFTPQEFQMIDMTKIDFSEWLKDLAGNINSVITNTIVPNATGAVQDFYNKIK